jgi:hypothetical protein
MDAIDSKDPRSDHGRRVIVYSNEQVWLIVC